MVEPWTVDPVVGGSNPLTHPIVCNGVLDTVLLYR